MAKCFVAIDNSNEKVAGYYTLSTDSIPADILPPHLTGDAFYPSIPVMLMGRLATDRNYRGLGLGKALVWDAIYKILDMPVGCYGIVVDAKDDKSQNFYIKFGFELINPETRRLLYPLKNVTGSPLELPTE